MRERSGTPGLLGGIFGCVFGVLGIFTLGLLFVPLAAICSLLGLLAALLGFSLTGLMVSLLGCFLTVAGFAALPSLWIIVAAMIGAAQPPKPERPSIAPPTVPDQSAPFHRQAMPPEAASHI